MKTKIFFSVLSVLAIIVFYFMFQDKIMNISLINPIYIDRIIIIILSVIITYVIAKFIDLLINNAFAKILKNDSLGKKMLPLIHNVSLIAVWTLSFLITVNILGFNINTLLTGAGIGGVILALAGKEAASNLFGSLSLILSKAFKIGDIIKIKTYEGTVEEITLSYTKLIDKKGNYIFMPNKNIISESIENLSHGKFKKLEIIIPLPINLGSKDVDSLIGEIEKYGAKSLKDEMIEDYKISFDSFSGNCQNIIFTFQTDIKTDGLNLKTEVYKDLRKILDKEKIEFKTV